MSAANDPDWARALQTLRHATREDASGLAHGAGAALATARGAASSTDVALEDAPGRVLARDVRALCPVPHYASSAMDGYAVNGPGPWRLVNAEDPARDTLPSAASDLALAPGTGVVVVTGGVIPEGTTTVVRDEYALRRGDAVELAPEAPRSELAGRHVRPTGTECAAGEILLEAGAVVSPAHAAFAAVAGVDALPVRTAPRVALVLTGSEVVTEGLPGPGRVRDAFGMSLPHVVTGMGAVVGEIRRVADDAATLRDAVRAVSATHDLVVTTGGTARSRADLVRPLLERDARLLVDQLDMQPGHPAVLAAADDAAVLALPGNPLGAVVALLVLGGAFVTGFLGRPPAAPRRAVAGAEISGGRAERLVPARLEDGAWYPCRAVGSNMLRGLSAADGLLSVPRGGLHAGQPTTALPLPW
ncbi:molybdopterin molybdenumtransferase MoeA [Kocuria varians]|uniref:Molybdopterin molybdenumtransferase n=1 Tax=Kocuria varians TaxID=1272 RepID=A0A4Y4CYL3_KOCVA|nr:molybdopterin-binding protein [Kocuria varians]GEC98028.1 molybdopterin molybdenumtransferase MoeA [Kocuria varians]